MAGINRTTGKATDLITFARASGGTALRKISYGSELVTNGTFDSDTTGWTGYSGGILGVSSGRLTVEGLAGDTVMHAAQEILTTVGKVYSFTVTAYTPYSRIRIGESVYVGGNYQNDNANGTYSGLFVATAEATYITLTSVGDGSVSEFDNISVKEVLFDQPDGTLTLFNHPTNIPRIEYDAAGNVKGLLIEEARTNLVTYSEAFDNAAWYKTGTTVTANAGISPDGSSTADLISETSTTSEHYVNQTVAAVSGTFTYSVWLKPSGVQFVILGERSTSGAQASFDLSSGSVKYAVLCSATIVEGANGWFLCSMTPTASFSSQNFGCRVQLDNNGINDSNNYLGNTSRGVYLYGAQLEAGSFPTSYIPTSGATATRAADIASISVDNFGYNQKAGTVVVEASSFGIVSGKTNRFLCLNNNSGAERINLFIEANSDLKMYCADNSVAQATITTGSTASDNAVFNIAGAYKTDDFAASADGNSAVLDTSGTLPTITQIQIGHELGINPLNGHIKSIAYYPRRLSNAQLQALTA